MSRMDLKSDNSIDSTLMTKFKNADMSSLPNFDIYENPLERGLWILWLAKDRLGIKQLSASQIVLIIREIKEITVKDRSIINAFNRVPDKVHRHNKTYYEIMKPGKDHLLAQVGTGPIEVFYFESGKKYSSRKILSSDILKNLKGELKIVDPYCGEQTLDVIAGTKNKIKFMTKLNNLRPQDKAIFLKALKIFKTEYKHIEFGDYTSSDIHDRYIISSEVLVILGHSIKDLGDKESFAIALDSCANKNIHETLCNNFNSRWKSVATL